MKLHPLKNKFTIFFFKIQYFVFISMGISYEYSQLSYLCDVSSFSASSFYSEDDCLSKVQFEG